VILSLPIKVTLIPSKLKFKINLEDSPFFKKVMLKTKKEVMLSPVVLSLNNSFSLLHFYLYLSYGYTDDNFKIPHLRSWQLRS
jgi:hypothetical protein